MPANDSIRAFKQSVGLSPYQYVLSERISVAKDLLLKRDLSIAAVALLVGFSDASQLNRPNVPRADMQRLTLNESGREADGAPLFCPWTAPTELNPEQRTWGLYELNLMSRCNHEV